MVIQKFIAKHVANTRGSLMHSLLIIRNFLFPTNLLIIIQAIFIIINREVAVGC